MRKPTAILAAIALLSLGGATPASPAVKPSLPPPVPTQPPAPATVAWVRKHAVRLPPEDAPVSREEAEALDHLFDGARVIAFGEPGHGNHEPLAYRNRLIRHLVVHGGLTAVAMESGIAETRRLEAYVAGGPGDPTALVREYFGWNFNLFVSNVEMIQWLRHWNDAHPGRKVRLYGIDTSGGFGDSRMGRAGIVLNDVTDYLGQTIPVAARDVLVRLSAFKGRFSDEAYAHYTAEERTRLNAALAEAQTLFATERAAMVAASSVQAFDVAEREALDCRTLEAMFAVWPSDDVEVRPAPGDYEVVRIRDRAMADHLIWVLDREGPAGRVLLFQADGHVRATAFRVAGWNSDALSTGQYLRARLGPAYRVLMSTSALGKPASDERMGSVTRALASVGAPRLLLDARDAPEGLWSGPQSLTDHASGAIGYAEVIPGKTYDGLIYFDRLTPEPALPGAPRE
jgi:erythromycin esterase